MRDKIKLSFALRITTLVFCCLLFSSLIVLGATVIVVKIGIKLPAGNITALIIIAFSISCVIGTCLAVLLSRHMAKEYEQFRSAIKEVANGNFDVVFPVEEGKLYGQIGQDFNTMVKELKSVQILRNDFISNFSHELKTPITSIKGFAELLMQDDLSESDRKEYAKIIFDESSRLLSLAKNTLLLSKLEGQGVMQNKSVFMLNELAENCLLLFSKDFTEKNIALSTDLEKIRYYWDENLISQVMINLISNAVKYSREGGNVRVELFRRDDSVFFIVRDDGIGMSEQVKARIFERYFQGDSSHKTEGNGLGLAIVSKIVFMCGGKITTDSVPEKGSVFTVELPYKTPAEKPTLTK